jgi:hypothetical protein
VQGLFDAGQRVAGLGGDVVAGAGGTRDNDVTAIRTAREYPTRSSNSDAELMLMRGCDTPSA